MLVSRATEFKPPSAIDLVEISPNINIIGRVIIRASAMLQTVPRVPSAFSRRRDLKLMSKTPFWFSRARLVQPTPGPRPKFPTSNIWPPSRVLKAVRRPIHQLCMNE